MEKGTECRTNRCGILKLIKDRRVGDSIFPERIFKKYNNNNNNNNIINNCQLNSKY
jgi:hypothetical protein